MKFATIDFLLLCGALAPLWMLAGVFIGGRLYPGYSHRQQAMSELGARGRPTARVHPYINNYPIGILFSAFGVGVMWSMQGHTLPYIGGVLLLVHGVAHIVAGIFPCDADMGAANGGSIAQKIHGVAGLAMFFALWLACVSWIFIGAPAGLAFRSYSLLSAVASIVSLSFMVRSLKTGRDLGLHQRISYGIIAVWCGVLALHLSSVGQESPAPVSMIH